MHIDKFDKIFDEYNNTYYRTIKILVNQVDILTVIFDVIINIQSFKLVITPNRPEKTIKLLLLFYFIIVNYFVTIKVLHQRYI